MDPNECIKTRRSIRKFTPDPVPQKDLKELIEIAQWRPSYKNPQPWEVIIVSGAKKETLSKILVDLLEKRTDPTPDFTTPSSWPAAEQKRIDYLMNKRKELTGLDLTAPEMKIGRAHV